MYKTIKRLIATGIVSVAFLSQSAVADMIFYYNAAVLPSIIAKKSNAKDNMALNAIMYPKMAAVAQFPFCLGSIDQLQGCVDLLSVAAPKPPEGAVEPVEGTNNCTSGSFDYSKTDDTYTITFNNCVDDANKRRLHEDLVVRACLYDRVPKILPGNAGGTGTYNVKYSGSVTCSPYIKTASNYVYRTQGNSESKPKMQWQYNGTLDLTTIVDVNATVRGIIKYGTAFQDWSDMPTTSDEEWQFANLSLELGNDSDKYTFDGKYTYIKHPNSAPNPNPDPVGHTFYMDFESMSYNFAHSGSDMDANVSGKMVASCYKDGVTYATKTVALLDVDTIRDANGSRMPSSGDMTSENAYVNATATFSAPANAQTSVASRYGTNLYESWREIVTGSTCQSIQDGLDGVLPDIPDTNDKIIEEKIVYEKEGSLVFSNFERTVTGQANGKNIWYYVAPSDGVTYNQDGTSKVSEIAFDFNATLGGSTNKVHVNVYLEDESGNAQAAVNIFNNADWTQLQTDHPNWTIRANYLEWVGLPDGGWKLGNFVLRLGGSTYSGSEEFIIEHYNVGSMP